jgi:hypothetical protein
MKTKSKWRNIVEGYWKKEDGMPTCCPNGKLF